jgi:hypothetical protein
MKLSKRANRALLIALHVGVPVLLAVAINVVIYTRQWNKSTNARRGNSALLPPGYVIAGVWIAILALLGAAYYVSAAATTYLSAPSVALPVMIAFCLLYPPVTFTTRVNVRVMNLISLVLASATLAASTLAGALAFALVAPLFAWTSYVCMTDAVRPCA